MRDVIFEIVSQIKPYDDLENQHINDTLNWIKSADQIFRVQKPDVPNKHLVAYFVLFNADKQKILLGDHIKSGLWLPAGGHVELNEHPKNTVKRECFEELNIQANFLNDEPIFLTSTITVGITAGHTDVSLWYVLKGDSNAIYDFDRNEFKSIQWFDFEAIPYDRSDPHMERFVEKLKEYIQ